MELRSDEPRCYDTNIFAEPGETRTHWCLSHGLFFRAVIFAFERHYQPPCPKCETERAPARVNEGVE